MLNRIRIHPLIYGAAALFAVGLPIVLRTNLWQDLLASDKYMPHGHCYLWEPGLIGLHMITDGLIGMAYVVISGTLAYLIYKARRDMPFQWMFGAFGLFIIACGATHFMEIWTLWVPAYWLAGAIKLVTAVASIITAAALPPLIPSILKLVKAAKVSEERGRQLQTRTNELAEMNESLKKEMAERMRAEQELRDAHAEALRLSERRYNTFAEIAPVGIFHTDTSGKHIYVNETWCQITGQNWIDAPFDVWAHALHPDDSAQIIEEWGKTVGQHADFKCEFRFLRPDGTTVWVIGQAKAERNGVGEVVGYVGTVTDITRRKHIEESLKQSIEESRRANDELSFYKFALDQAAIVAVTDPRGTIEFVNDKFCQISGYQREELLGKNHRLLNSGYHPRTFFKEMYGTIARGKVWRGELRNRAKDGHIYWVDTTIIPTKNADGRITQYVAIRADITERKNAEAALEANRRIVEAANHELAATNGRLSALYQTAQRFVDDVSHEFRTPLSVIKGYSEIMRDGLAGPMSPKQTQFTQLIVDRTRDMAQMVDDLLDTSKLRAGSLRVDRKACDIAEIFATVRPLIEGRAMGNKVRLIFQIEPGLPRVFADSEKVVRVLVNLAVNAIKFSPEETRVVLWARADQNDQVRVGVTDEGPGISPENLAIIFERFRRIGEAPSGTKGFGLGLNIAKELVALNFGSMSVASEVHQGSTFSFTLPRNDARVIATRLFEHLAALKIPEGNLALLRVTPDRAGLAPEELRSFLASSAHSADIIQTSADGSALLLFGYSAKPERWRERLTQAGASIQPLRPTQKLCSFGAQLINTWNYPNQTDAALQAFLAELSEVPVHA